MVSPGQAQEPLTWNRFLQLRKVRRRINLVTSIIGAAGCVAGSAYLISSHNVDTLASQYLGLDAFITMGIIVVTTVATGWLIGPFFGNALFSLRYRSIRIPLQNVRPVILFPIACIDADIL
jgi:import inner membrane translocase subunit TIM23